MAHLQGPVPLGDDHYVQRPFEHELLRELMADRWVLLLGPRQHGKTSALVRLQTELSENGVPAAIVDLQAAPAPQSYAEFAAWVGSEVRRQLATADQPNNDSEDIGVLLGAALPPGNTPAVILVDEASNIPDTRWRNAFYGQLRAISSRRATARPEDAAARLRFVFAGTFRYESLIDAANSPFNVCERIDTDDLTVDDVCALTCQILGNENAPLSQPIFEEVGGQPFLVQKLLSKLQGCEEMQAALGAEITKLRTGESDHIIDLFRKMLSEPSLAAIGARMVRDGVAPVEAADPDFRYMQVLGLARRAGANLVFRNQLYARIAATSPQLGGMAPAPTLAPMFPVSIDAFNNVQNAELREIAWAGHKGAIAAYRAGSNRLALAGFGGSLEAMLLDLLMRLPNGALAPIVAQANITLRGGERTNNPATWNLVNLIKAAPHAGGGQGFDPPQALREWRNLIHPAVAQRNYRPDHELEPEARAAANLHEILLRDLP
ncbi:AAA-like domain-containing protein [Roseibium aggregatum]|uniref:AAA-like domain-containing protein n=1 Tax=Roseibium aggregatum TaxID=187304 RepID=UPI0025AD1CEB|nr:AAA-like domain-containing protein [Roseibium aggregatum]WJS03179.1 AAA-like domain-containing protein [Roseibium aggregatum]